MQHTQKIYRLSDTSFKNFLFKCFWSRFTHFPVTHRCILIYGEQVSLLNDTFQEWRKIRKNLLARFWLLTIRMLVLYTERTDDD